MSAGKSQDATPGPGEIFSYFTEIGIISQLSSALLAKVLPDGVHPSHFAIVQHLIRRGDGKPPVRIASAMQITKATMTHSLAVLEKRGFVETRPSPGDARSKLVYLTDAGRAFHAQAIEEVIRAFGRIIGDEHAEIMREALPGLAAIRKLLDENRIPLSEEKA